MVIVEQRVDSVLSELQACGTDQNRKVYARHGVRQPMYGVSFANLKQLRKKYRPNHQLALELWASGNHDARLLATMIADPKRATLAEINTWGKDLDNYVLTDAFAVYVASLPLAETRMPQWMRSKNEWLGTAGWTILALKCQGETDFSDEELLAYLPQIEQGIGTAKNRVKHAMNNALIAIGIRNAALARAAKAAARRIGAVAVNHGDTNCHTPDAATAIDKARARKKK